MPLPKVVHPSSTVDVDGQAVAVRGLTRAENAHVSRLIDDRQIEDAEIYVLAAATDTPPDVAAAWYAATSNRAVEAVLDLAGELTRLDEGASKSGPASVHARGGNGVGLPVSREVAQDRG